MTARLDLVAHGVTAATREARFPDDDALETPSAGIVEALRIRMRSYRRVVTAPARAARETAAVLGLQADVEAALRDCDCGRWRGHAAADVAAREPRAFAAWLGDPAAAPHDGESLAALIERVGAWLRESLSREGATLAVTHAAVVRAAVVNALGAPAPAFWRIDVAPFTLARFSGHEGRWNLVALQPSGSMA